MKRSIPLVLGMLVAVLGAAAALALSGGRASTAHADSMHMNMHGHARPLGYEHLGLTTDEVVDRLQHRWAASVRVADRINSQALEMADMPTAGIVAQFPAKLGQA